MNRNQPNTVSVVLLVAIVLIAIACVGAYLFKRQQHLREAAEAAQLKARAMQQAAERARRN
jgi:uncharacterized protein HemX